MERKKYTLPRLINEVIDNKSAEKITFSYSPDHYNGSQIEIFDGSNDRKKSNLPMDTEYEIAIEDTVNDRSRFPRLYFKNDKYIDYLRKDRIVNNNTPVFIMNITKSFKDNCSFWQTNHYKKEYRGIVPPSHKLEDGSEEVCTEGLDLYPEYKGGKSIRLKRGKSKKNSRRSKRTNRRKMK
jgi:hypothetical protein